jgi:hypothetical protein
MALIKLQFRKKKFNGNVTVPNEINSSRILSKEDSRDNKTLQG